MGEITHVDLDMLRHLADRVSTAAAELVDMHCAELDPDELPGSAVCASATPGPITDRIRDVAASLLDWAVAARTSADAFERADTGNGERFAPR